MWAQIAAAALGGGINSMTAYGQRKHERSQIGGMISAERENRRALMDQRESVANDTRATMADAFTAFSMARNPNDSQAMRGIHSTANQVGRQDIRSLDNSISGSVMKEQQLNASKPKAYGFDDFMTDFIGGGLKGYQIAEGFEDKQQAKEDYTMFKEESINKMKSWTNLLNTMNTQLNPITPTSGMQYNQQLKGAGQLSWMRNDWGE